jgi:FKBP-type peptidyl-prolyl cis-trans isomerase SlpA
MKIEKDAAVSLQVQIVEGGKVSPAQEMTYLHGNGNLFPKMEAALAGLEAGGKASITLSPADGFGERDPALVQRVGRAALDAEGDADGDYRVGDVVRFPAPGGQSIAGIVRDVEDDAVVFDFNHPLAGRPVTFDVRLIGVL